MGYCSFAAALCKVPFLFTAGHPQTLSGFAAYELKQFQGLVAVALNSDDFPIPSFVLALQECVLVRIVVPNGLTIYRTLTPTNIPISKKLSPYQPTLSPHHLTPPASSPSPLSSSFTPPSHPLPPLLPPPLSSPPSLLPPPPVSPSPPSQVLSTQSSAEKLTALPIVVLLEYAQGCLLRSPTAWLDARLLRVRLLISLRMFSGDALTD